jgi:hypothetical protein
LTIIQKRLLDGVFCLMLVYILLASTTYTMDIYFKANTVGWLTACRVSLLIAGVLFLVSVRATLVRAIDPIAVIAIAIIVVGGIVGLLGNADWPAYLRHGFQYVFLLVFYLIGRIVARYGILPWQMTVACVTVLLGYTIATIFYLLVPGLHSGAYSFQPDLALLPIAYNASYFMSAAAIILILIGNKRAIFLSACFCIAAIATEWALRRTGGVRPAIRMAATLALMLAAATGAIAILSELQIPLVSMVADRFSTAPTFVNTDTKARMEQSQTSPGKAGPVESDVDPIARLTSARNVEVEAVWRLIKSHILTGAGFGSGFEVKYLSPNDYQPVSFWRDQADLMPVHVAMTSGVPLSILFIAAFFMASIRVFSRLNKLENIDKTIALFALCLSLDIFFGFIGTNPVLWSAIGYATMISRSDRTVSAA